MVGRIAQQQFLDQLRMVELEDLPAKTSVVIQVSKPAGGGEHEVGRVLTEEISRKQTLRQPRAFGVAGARTANDVRCDHLGREGKAHSSSLVPLRLTRSIHLHSRQSRGLSVAPGNGPISANLFRMFFVQTPTDSSS